MRFSVSTERELEATSGIESEYTVLQSRHTTFTCMLADHWGKEIDKKPCTLTKNCLRWVPGNPPAGTRFHAPIGHWPPLKVSEAREQAHQMLADLRRGLDPALEHKARQRARAAGETTIAQLTQSTCKILNFGRGWVGHAIGRTQVRGFFTGTAS